VPFKGRYSMKKKLLFIFGTRPEAIKMSPLIRGLLERKDKFETKVCVTAQHRQMLDQTLSFFDIHADFDLDLMKPGQSIFDITSDGIRLLERVLKEYQPDLVLVQGDTTTSFIGSLASYYCKIKVAHIEAGLRSGNKFSPFPEEMNRILTGHLSDFHFAPTQQAIANLQTANIKEHIYQVGNTVIDALFLGLEIIRKHGEAGYQSFFNFLSFENEIVLITGHRRESFGEPFENICKAIRKAAHTFPEVQFVYPVHLNPNVQSPVKKILSGLQNVFLIEPLDYPHFIWLMNKSYVVLTDSGGLQEEAPSLGKPVLVMRDVTERTEGIEVGTARLVGTDPNRIFESLSELLSNKTAYLLMAQSANPYGDGHSAQKIIEVIEKVL